VYEFHRRPLTDYLADLNVGPSGGSYLRNDFRLLAPVIGRGDTYMVNHAQVWEPNVSDAVYAPNLAACVAHPVAVIVLPRPPGAAGSEPSGPETFTLLHELAHITFGSRPMTDGDLRASAYGLNVLWASRCLLPPVSWSGTAAAGLLALSTLLARRDARKRAGDSTRILATETFADAHALVWMTELGLADGLRALRDRPKKYDRYLFSLHRDSLAANVSAEQLEGLVAARIASFEGNLDRAIEGALVDVYDETPIPPPPRADVGIMLATVALAMLAPSRGAISPLRFELLLTAGVLSWSLLEHLRLLAVMHQLDIAGQAEGWLSHIRQQSARRVGPSASPNQATGT